MPADIGFITAILIAFVPIFVAVDIAGLLPLFLGMTDRLNRNERRRASVYAVLTAFIVGAAFIFIGKVVFRLLGITVWDFKIAGGLLLLTLAVIDLLLPNKLARAGHAHETETAIVPLGVPLIVGPAVLTTVMILRDIYGPWITLAALSANLLLALIALRQADILTRLTGVGGMRAISKVVMLLLAAIGVMMLRDGIGQVLSNWGLIAGTT